jgi:hypothetical protein
MTTITVVAPVVYRPACHVCRRLDHPMAALPVAGVGAVILCADCLLDGLRAIRDARETE